MSLTEYKRKRDFRKTPEPAGRPKVSRSGRQFVIQKHAASRLHYDFRLELDGVLKSWAVPKGPSLDPHVKALAVQVEDHPLDYASFEGTIPQGQYGGGTVMVWDQGTWEPEGNEDASRALRKGRLKFQLHGQKLHGSWALVQMHGERSDDGKNWLLIKHADDAAQPELEHRVQDEDRSVITGRSLDEIAEAKDAVWQSNRPEKKKAVARPRTPRQSRKQRTAAVVDFAALPGASTHRLPGEFTPQLATLVEQIPTGDDWLHEMKFDGYRILAWKRGGDVQLKTRTSQDWTHRFPTVARAVAALPLTDALCDGEIVALDDHGGTSFQSLQRALEEGRETALVYYIFDLPFAEGVQLTGVPLMDRKEALRKVLLAADPDNSGTVRYSDYVRGQGETVLQRACQAQAEGILSKRVDSTYEQRRSRSWVKTKCLRRQEFVIGGYTKPAGSRTGFGSLLLGYFEDGKFIYCGNVGTGFNTATLQHLVKLFDKVRTDQPPFDKLPPPARRRGTTWVKPVYVAEVEFLEWTSDGILRHPSFQGLREDKPAREIGREVAQPSPDRSRHTSSRKSNMKTADVKVPAPLRMAGTGSGEQLPVGRGKKPSPATKLNPRRRKEAVSTTNSKAGDTVVAGVTLSNPSRVVYPEQNISKLELARYYEFIADRMLPHVAGRPLALVRCPQGRQQKCFYQKHVTDAMPDAIHGVDVPEKDGIGKHVVINDLQGLISLVQMGILEIHPWGCKADDIDRPDRLVFDLDPGEGLGWDAVIQGALDVRDALSELGLESFVRTSGGKGLHVVLPIVRRHDFDTIKQFTQWIALGLERRHPDKYIVNMSKAKRKGKIFVDYLRNGQGATAAATYSTRARANAPIVTPIRWDELSLELKADAFNVRNLPQRLSKLKKDPWAGFFTLRQNITTAMLNAARDRAAGR